MQIYLNGSANIEQCASPGKIPRIPYCCSPLHVCAAVAEGKCKNDNSEGPIIECRRCPIAYHKDCIPLNLWLTRSGSSAAQRVWLAQPEDSQDDPDVEGCL